MKRTLPVLLGLALATMALATMAWGDTIGDQIKAANKELSDKQDALAGVAGKIKAHAQKMDDIKWAAQQYKNQRERLNGEMDVVSQKIAQHNANQCTEKCVNGKCDGSCQWYRDKAVALNSEGAQLNAQSAQLDQIRDTVSSQTVEWVKTAKDLTAEYDRLQGIIDKLQAQLSDLRGQYDQCRGSIPLNCDAPDAVDKNGKPLLNGACEKMHSRCGKMFDGNK